MHLSGNIRLQGGKYEIIEKIGQGGFGIAYKANHLLLNKIVCIKEFFYSDLCERKQNSSELTIISASSEKIQLVDSFKKKFIKEAQRLAAFQHPNIVQVTDVFEENNTAYFVMEYLEGGSLQDKLDKTTLTEDQTLKIILPVLDALSAVHKAKLLHLDIKPTNIMFRKDGTPVLIDFGISKYMANSGGQTSTAPIGLSKGYAPIEQYGGDVSDFSEATDVYSVCATMYKMLTGEVPPEPLQIMGNGLKRPKDFNSSLSDELNLLIIKGMSVKDRDRPQNSSELHLLLQQRVVKEEYNVISQKEFSDLKRQNDPEVTLLEREPSNGTSKPQSKLLLRVALFLISALGLFLTLKFIPKISNQLQSDESLTIVGFDDINKTEDYTVNNNSVVYENSKLEDMVLVNGGDFNLGSNVNFTDESPAHIVTLNSFYIDKYEVTIGQFERFVNNTGYKTEAELIGYNYIQNKNFYFSKKENVNWRHDEMGNLIDTSSEDSLRAVIRIGWDDAMAYAKWIGKRLPTEAEWEFAAKGGLLSNQYQYSGSNNIYEVANNMSGKVSKVGMLKPNELGIYDMTGNVYEWCYDFYDPYYYKNSPRKNPTGPSQGTLLLWDRDSQREYPVSDKTNKYRVFRGGSCMYYQEDMRVTYRGRSYHSGTSTKVLIGFRCVMDI